MELSRSHWDQLKPCTSDDLIRALVRDGWREDINNNATRAFRKSAHERVVIHYHPKKTYGKALMKHLLTDIGWTVSDLQRLKLIK